MKLAQPKGRGVGVSAREAIERLVHHEHVLVGVRVELGSLLPPLDVLEGEGVERELVLEDPEVGRGGGSQREPHDRARRARRRSISPNRSGGSSSTVPWTDEQRAAARRRPTRSLGRVRGRPPPFSPQGYASTFALGVQLG